MGKRRPSELTTADDLLGDGDETRRSRREGPGWIAMLLVLLGLAVIFGGAYALAYVLADDRVPRGTTISGVDVGGMSPAAATTRLESQLGPRLAQPLTVTVGGRQEVLPTAGMGFSVDYRASVANAGAGSSWAPGRLWDYWTGGGAVEPVVRSDAAALDRAVASLADRVAAPPTNGRVLFRPDATIRTTEPRTGRAVDQDTARAAVATAYLSLDRALRLPLQQVQPDVGPDDVQAALDSFANAAVSGPVTLQFGRTDVRLTPRQFVGTISMVPQGGALVPRLDERALSRLVAGRVAQADEPVDATVRLVDGRPQVVPARPGVTYDPQQISSAFLSVVARSSGQRTLAVRSTVQPADFTTKDARALRIREEVSTFTTYFPYAEYRNTNIGRAAELVDGTVLKPGETFSMNGTVGERTRENGFTDGFVISNGIFKEDLGGGVSQMATTLFNGAFFAGLEDVEHKPHSFYIDRYPVGREATVAWGSVDLRFRNDTPYGVLIDAEVTPSTPSSQGVVRVSMWSTDYWDISAETSARYDFTSPATRTLTGDDCVDNSGYGGFDVDVTRVFRRAGESTVDHREVMHTTYTPSDTVICR